MNPTSIKAAFCLNLAAILFLVAPAAHAGVVYIDTLTTATVQSNTTFNSSSTNTVSAVGAVGGFRTFELSSFDNDGSGQNSTLQVRTNYPVNTNLASGPRLSLSSGNDATANFTVTWGGANGTAGLGGIDFRDGIAATNFSLVSSTLNFSLLTSDVTNSVTWTFTDTSANVATYTQSIPSKSGANPALAYSVSLNSFLGAGTINWSSINFITLSGGGTASLDLNLGPVFSVNAQPIPEPGTWAAAGLLVLTAFFYTRRRRMRAAATEEAPAAAA